MGVIFRGSLHWFSPWNYTSSCAVIMERTVMEHHIWIGRIVNRLIIRNAKPAPKLIHNRLMPSFLSLWFFFFKGRWDDLGKYPIKQDLNYRPNTHTNDISRRGKRQIKTWAAATLHFIWRSCSYHQITEEYGLNSKKINGKKRIT